MRKFGILLFGGITFMLGLLSMPLMNSLFTSSPSCPLGVVGAQDNPCLEQESTIRSLRRTATNEIRFARLKIARLETRIASAATPTLRPTTTPIPTSTLDPRSFDITQAKLFEGTFDEFEMPLPIGWTNLSSGVPNQYNFSFGDVQHSIAQVRIFVIERSELSALLDISESVTTTEEAITQYKAGLYPEQYSEIGEVIKSTIGVYDGFSLAYTAPPNPQTGNPDATKIELRVADIPDTTKTIALVYFVEGSRWDQFNPVIEAMIDGMIFRVGNVPTPTMTPTIYVHPLQMTATYVQTLIIGLTPTP